MNGEYSKNKWTLLCGLLVFLGFSIGTIYESYKILLLGIEPHTAKGYAAIPGAIVFPAFIIWAWMNRKDILQDALIVNELGIGFGRKKKYQFFKWDDIKEASVSGMGLVIKIKSKEGVTSAIPASFNVLGYEVDSYELIEHLRVMGQSNNFSVI
ncbi:hypothetical protein EYS14_24230 [Alteromonadaceae bacterium M269]|nr:hypothetical protein EYS14_24230 [Alteromonadaceae bacterium M269]